MSDLFEGWEGFDAQEERRIGKEIGKEIQIIDLVCKKLKKGKDASTIAEEVEEDQAYVETIIGVAGKYAPAYDAEKIQEELESMRVSV